MRAHERAYLDFPSTQARMQVLLESHYSTLGDRTKRMLNDPKAVEVAAAMEVAAAAEEEEASAAAASRPVDGARSLVKWLVRWLVRWRLRPTSRSECRPSTSQSALPAS